MKHFITFLCLLSYFFTTAQSIKNQQPTNPSGADYKPGAVIFKWLPEYRDAWVESDHQPKTWRLNDPALQQLLARYGAHTIRPLFPQHIGRKAGKVDLSLIGEFQLAASVDVPALCRQLSATGRFQYVEPRFIYKTSGEPSSASLNNGAPPPVFLPNDSLFSQQWHLAKIHAPEAWDIEQGDTSIVIGIVDSSVDYLHPDLVANIAFNYADPINGQDDDGNGFIDDFQGWDFYYNDNDPRLGANHGTAVAGVAAASTNNGIGLASPGYNCRILPIKCASDNPNDINILFGVEGIVYAADRGCKIINCSWGGVGTGFLYKDIVEYVTFEKNALIISVSHNYNTDERFMPSSADYVVSVAATDPQDVREPYSNYNYLVDISAPSNIWVTLMDGAYADHWTGTSLSGPQVAGAAALLASHDPSLNGLQLAERLRVTSDPIDAQNPNYVEQLGRGRLNLYRALTDPATPAVRFEHPLFVDGRWELFQVGDTVRLSGEFVNYLAPVTGLTVTASSLNSSIAWIQPNLQIGNLATFDTATNHQQPFIFVVQPGAPFDTEIPIRLGFQGDGYTDWQWVYVRINRGRVDFDNGRIATTLNSTGRMGFVDEWGDGRGLYDYNNPLQMEGVLAPMFGNSTSRVSDAALNSWSSPTSFFTNDFKILESLHPDPLSPADVAYTCMYSDSAVVPPTFRMGLEVRQRNFAWNNDPFFITEYEVTNQSANTYSTFHIGLWGELELFFYDQNRAEQDESLKLGYMYNPLEPNFYAGIQLLGSSPYNLYVYDYSPTYGGVNLNDSYSNSEKYTTLTQNRPTGGFEDADGSDVGLVVSSGPYNLAPGNIQKAAFAFLVAESLPALQDAAVAAQLRYASLSTGIQTPIAYENLQVSPNPAGESIALQLDPGADWEVMMYDSKGRLHYQTRTNGPQVVSLAGWPAGVYFVRAVAGGRVSVGRVVKR
ncbi:MAG: S8 family serine peptidase [Saprospiraceae bacterium]|nr:S8 family serine peptidase [Saprospiraceae bacterium]